MATEPVQEPGDEEAPAKSNKGLIIAFVGLVVMVETGMFFFLRSGC